MKRKREKKINFVFAWYDLWVGAYCDVEKDWWYFFPVPCFGILWKRLPTNYSIIKLPRMHDEKGMDLVLVKDGVSLKTYYNAKDKKEAIADAWNDHIIEISAPNMAWAKDYWIPTSESQIVKDDVSYVLVCDVSPGEKLHYYAGSREMQKCPANVKTALLKTYSTFFPFNITDYNFAMKYETREIAQKNCDSINEKQTLFKYHVEEHSY